jgi:8-oxo-dGTP pyrophosphatase MutT (NUDIX family)
MREREGLVEFLQLRRTAEPMAGTWQPAMGHVESGETAMHTAVRELGEEVGLRAGDPAWLGFWQLEEVHPYFVAALDAVVLSPRFAVLVDEPWEPDLSGEDAHDAYRWVEAASVGEMFMWPGQCRACDEAMGLLARRGSAIERALWLGPGG